MVDRESVVSDVRWVFRKGSRFVRRRAQHRAGIRPSSRRVAHDDRPAPFKGRERNDAVHAVAADNAVLGSESVAPSVAELQATCTDYLHRVPVYFVCVLPYDNGLQARLSCRTLS